MTFKSEAEALVRYLSDDERQHGDKVSAVQRLYRLNTADKVVTALKGNREERAILIRDPNRIVASAVLGSPRITESEIESFASMKNVSDEISARSEPQLVDAPLRLRLQLCGPATPLAISSMSPLNPKESSLAVTTFPRPSASTIASCDRPCGPSDIESLPTPTILGLQDGVGASAAAYARLAWSVTRRFPDPPRSPLPGVPSRT